MSDTQNNLLTPKQVARALGVSEASLKRWCDKGLLPVIRTAGGHRRLPIAGVMEFIRQSKRPMVSPEVLGLPPTSGQTEIVIDRAMGRFYDALIEGDETRIRGILFDLHLADHSIDALADRLISPVLQQIGENMAENRVCVFQERRASDLCQRALLHLANYLEPPAENAPKAIGGALANDWHNIPTLLCEMTLRQIGWAANSLGTNLPAYSIVEAMRAYHPRLVWVSFSHVTDTQTLINDCNTIFQAATEMGIAFVVGGSELNAELKKQISYTSYHETLGRLVPFAKALNPESNAASA